MLNEYVRVDESEDGKGLFAITLGSVILKVSRPSLSFNETKELGERESYCLQIAERSYILPEYPFYYSNHACNPNCGLNEKREFITLTDIAEGEELRWDYSTSMLERSWNIPCD